MGYRPIGRGILISFDADWKNTVDIRGKIQKRGRSDSDFGEIFKSHLEQMYPDLYVESMGAGDDATAYSLYVEEKGVKLKDLEKRVEYGLSGNVAKLYDLIEQGTKTRFFDMLKHTGSAAGLSNFSVRKAELEEARQVYGAPRIVATRS